VAVVLGPPISSGKLLRIVHFHSLVIIVGDAHCASFFVRGNDISAPATKMFKDFCLLLFAELKFLVGTSQKVNTQNIPGLKIITLSGYCCCVTEGRKSVFAVSRLVF